VANCGLLKNDGSSFFLLNAGGVLLLNDNTCGTEAGVSASVLGATGTGTATLTGAFATLVAAALSATGIGDATFQGFPPAAAATDGATVPGGAGWSDQLSARERQERWDALNKRMGLLQRKKTRISMDIGELRFELRDESHPGRIKKLQGKLSAAMDAIMAIEDELQELYIRMMQ
jgi:hypothetical protein